MVTRGGEKITHTMTHPGPAMMSRIQESAIWRDEDDVYPAIAPEPESMRPDTLALTRGMLWYPARDDQAEMTISYRPIVLMRRYAPLEAVPVLTHEFSHVLDMFENPIKTGSFDDMLLETELRACAAEDTMNKVVHGYSTSMPIERLRRRHNGALQGADAFRASDGIKVALERHGLTYIYL